MYLFSNESYKNKPSLNRIDLNANASGWFYTDFFLAKQFC